MAITIRNLDSSAEGFKKALHAVLAFEASEDEAIERSVAQILADVKARGDAAVLDCTNRFDRLSATSVAALELPFMVAWGYALRWLSKHTIIICGALLYAAYLVLISRAGSVAEVLWLQLLNGPATAALLTIPISYLQDAIRGRVGLSTSLLDVTHVVAAIVSATLFGVLTGSVQNYPQLMVVAAGLSAAGAAILFAAHRLFRAAPLPLATGSPPRAPS